MESTVKFLTAEECIQYHAKIMDDMHTGRELTQQEAKEYITFLLNSLHRIGLVIKAKHEADLAAEQAVLDEVLENADPSTIN